VNDLMAWTFVFLLVFGGSSWRAWNSWHQKKQETERRKLEGPRPICGCEHNYSYHSAKGCPETVQVAVEWVRDDFGDVVATRWEARTCPCVGYVGPQPLPEMFLPEITGSIPQISPEKNDDR